MSVSAAQTDALAALLLLEAVGSSSQVADPCAHAPSCRFSSTMARP